MSTPTIPGPVAITFGDTVYIATPGTVPPPALEGWNHSKRVLAYYAPVPELAISARWAVSYYHYSPPFVDKPKWISFTDYCDGWTPAWWWSLPPIPYANEVKAAAKAPPPVP